MPTKQCDEFNTLCAKFWWGQVGEERKIHWKSRSVLTQAKKMGGMGFRDLRPFNLAMLAKQGWRFLLNQESLVYRCFKARYFPRCSFLDAVDSSNSSYVWKSILAGQPILKKVFVGEWVMELPYILCGINGFLTTLHIWSFFHQLRNNGNGGYRISLILS